MDTNRYLKAVNIEWDVDLAEDLDSPPKEVQIPDGMTDTEEISDYLSNLTGFCHRGFGLKETERYQVKLCYGYEQRSQSTYQPHQTQRCTAKAHFLTEVHLRTQGIENRGSTSVLPRFIRLSRQRTRHSCSCRICAAQ